MRLTITNQHVQAADRARAWDPRENRRSWGTICPTAQALHDLGYEQVYVGCSVAVVKRGGWRGVFRLPPVLQGEIQSWDHGFGFRPMEVEVTPANSPAKEAFRAGFGKV